jgi:Zn-dependent alcohol dehydrogenase
MECINYGTSKCANCSQGQQNYCKTLHEKIENGTYNIADDYWDYIDSVIDDEELEDLLDF